MKRLFMFAVLCAFLFGTASRVAVAGPTLPDALQSVAALIDVQIQAIPHPAVTPADKAALKAWRSAARLVDEAIENPSPTRFAGLLATVDRTLILALGRSPAVIEILDALTDGLLAGTAQVLANTRARVLLLPPGRTRNKLLARLGVADGLLADADAASTRAGARRLARRALDIAAAVEKDRKRQVKHLVALKGLAVIADGEPFAIEHIFSGSVVKDMATGKPLAISVEWRRTAGNVTRTCWFRIDPNHMKPEGVSGRTLGLGTYPVNDVYITAAATKTVGSGGTMQIDSATGTGSITLVSLDASGTTSPLPGSGHGSVSGYFTFTGFDVAGPGTGLKVTGRFNVAKRPNGLQILPAVGPLPFPKTSDR